MQIRKWSHFWQSIYLTNTTLAHWLTLMVKEEQKTRKIFKIGNFDFVVLFWERRKLCVRWFNRLFYLSVYFFNLDKFIILCWFMQSIANTLFNSYATTTKKNEKSEKKLEWTLNKHQVNGFQFNYKMNTSEWWIRNMPWIEN